MGKLIVIEGLDSSGKATQSERLYERLTTSNIPAKKVTFPDYGSQSSALIKMYLNGEFGTDANAVNPYVASTFYTVDRFASFKTKWQAAYENGTVIVADRYTTSNMIHQASKIESSEERRQYFKWLMHYEYTMFGLPKPDMVIFLHMPLSVSLALMEERANKYTGEMEKDIHEKNKAYLANCYNIAMEVCKEFNWNMVSCTQGAKIRTIEEIQEEIYQLVSNLL